MFSKSGPVPESEPFSNKTPCLFNGAGCDNYDKILYYSFCSSVFSFSFDSSSWEACASSC